ncbi:MAG: ABC transporter permease, partial [Phycisphaerales bacterium]|nr:ABC transporter permease [Phycisphaerales bacterium]
RLRTSAISMPQILLGKAIACFLSTVLVCAVMISCGWLFFGVQPTSIGLLALAIVSVAVGFVGVMMVLSVLGRTEQSAGGIGWAALTMLAMIGGGMVPAVFMPAWMQSIGSISPIFWAIRAFEGPIWRETSLVGMLQPCGILLAMGVGLFALGATIFNRTERA